MAALGIWLWSNPRTFGAGNLCAVDFASVTIVGRHVPFASNSLRVGSLLIYTVFLVPGINLMVPLVAFLSLYLAYHSWMKTHPRAIRIPAKTLTSSPHRRTRNPLKMLAPRVEEWYDRSISTSGVLPVLVGLSVLFIVNIIFLVDIELTLQRNRQLQGSDSDEAEWGFGQILAMLLLVLPFRDLIETVLARREKRHERQRERQRREELTKSLKEAIKEKSSRLFLDLVE
ncbi:hypothetical protein BXZ70DRAFT_1007403 [Cristinia sonorae]|uniref:Uncharacterized protein n=1 Tax=Cristinia sonorae TaxID=1940300 RepID=A0A8K0XQM6_9AGAR|nr:hypothetical protein BXZ70DRAFT_1007403 [Cristinia sonorae]